MTLQKQLTLMTMVTVAGLLAVVIFVALSLGRLQHQFDDYQSRQILDKSLIEIKASALAMSRLDPILPDTREKLTQAEAHIKELGQMINSQAEGEKIKSVLKVWQEYARGFEGAIKIASESPADALVIPDALYKSHLEPMVADLDGMVAVHKVEEVQSRQRIRSDMTRILWVVLLPLVLAGLVVTVFQVIFSRSLKRRGGGVTEGGDPPASGRPDPPPASRQRRRNQRHGQDHQWLHRPLRGHPARRACVR